MIDWYDRAGLPISVEEWGRLNSIEDYKRVAATQVGPYWVSTVWLGLDHGWMSDAPPVIFETMVFASSPDVDGLGPDLDCYRYCTEEQALAGHEEVVTLVRATLQEQPQLDVDSSDK